MCSVESLPEDTELLVAGFPCIDVSRAGLRRGITGQSTGLVKHVFRLLKVASDNNRPINWVLLENVEALLDRIDDQPPPIAFVVQQLEELGYGSWAYRVINSAGFGVPMRRKRVFIVASMHGDARDVLLTQGMQQCLGACKQLFEGNMCFSCRKMETKNRTSNKEVNFALDLGQATARPAEDVVPSLTTSNDRILLLLRDGRVGMLRVEDGERLQGLPEGWTKNVYPVTGEGVHGHRRQHGRENDLETHNSKRWQLLGNAVTVDVGRWLGERLMNPYTYKYRNAEGSFRMDDLIYEDQKGIRKRDGGATKDLRGASREPHNVWSFVTVDEIQEAAIFSFKDSNENKRARLAMLREEREKSDILLPPVELENQVLTEGGDEERSRGETGAGDASTGSQGGERGNEKEGATVETEAVEHEMEKKCKKMQRINEGKDDGEDKQNGEDGNEVVPRQNGGRKGAKTVAPAPSRSMRTRRGKRSATPELEYPPDSRMGPGHDAAVEEPPKDEPTKLADESPGCEVDAEILPEDRPDTDETSDTLDDLVILTPSKTHDAARLDVHSPEGQEKNVGMSDAALRPYKDRFQAKIYTRIKRGLLQSSSLKDKRRIPSHLSDKTWPKCAWGQKGIGRFGMTRWHDHPVLCPFQSLDEYITQVGRPPTQEERAGYVHRLKEKGWDISEEVLSRISGTHKLTSKSVGVTRIEGLLDDADMVGDLVWAPWKDGSKDSGEIFWPGEVLDPINIPIGRTLPKNALDHLTSDEKRASTISLTNAWNHEEYADSEHRRVLVMFFPVNNGKWQWYPPKVLVPWKENRPEYEKRAHDIIKKPSFNRGDMLEHALQDAVASYGVKNNKSSITSDKMRQTRAAAASAMVDLKQRCGRCRTCMNAYAGTKRYDCLTQRMTASALGGHAGAQLSMCGDAAVGARVAVWWDGDEEYFEGTICWYDPVSTEHTVAYDDGEIGMHRLWQHDEHILIKSDIEEWNQEAMAVRERLKKAMQEPLTELMSSEDIENNKRASELASRMPELTEYEKERQENLVAIKNKFKLFLGL